VPSLPSLTESRCIKMSEEETNTVIVFRGFCFIVLKYTPYTPTYIHNDKVIAISASSVLIITQIATV